MQSDRDALETRRALEEAEKNVLAGQLAQQRLKEEELMRQRVRVEQEKYLVQVVMACMLACLVKTGTFHPINLFLNILVLKRLEEALLSCFSPVFLTVFLTI